MGRPPSFFTNLGIRQSPKIPLQNPNNQMRKKNLCNSNGGNEEFLPNSDAKAIQNHRFKSHSFSEVAKEVSRIIRTRPRWEQTLFADFPTLNFVDPMFYNEVLKHQNNAFLSLRFYHWISSQNGFLPDQFPLSVIFSGLVEAKAAKAAKNFLEVTKFIPEPCYLEPYAECLCENGLIEEAVDVFDHLRRASYCPALRTWNSALSGSLQAGRSDLVWKFYGDMIESAVASDVDTTGYLIQAFCAENIVWKGYDLLRQVLEDGHIPSKVVFHKLICLFCKNGNYSRMSDLLHIMIEKNHSPDIFTYQEVINGLCKRNMKHEGFQVFKDLKDRGYTLDRVMYTTMICGLCKLKWLGDARKLWSEMRQKGMVPNEYTYSALISGYFKVGNLAEVDRLYKEMCEIGYGETTVSYNTMIKGLCLNGKVEAAYDLFKQMAVKNVACDVITFNSLIQGFCKEGSLNMGTNIFYELLKQGLQPSTASYTVLIEKLCEMGHVEEASLLWNDMQERGVTPVNGTHDSIVLGLVEQGYLLEGMKRLNDMLKSRLKPRKKTFERLIQCLSEGENWDDTFLVLSCMLKVGYALNQHICLSLVTQLCKDSFGYVETYIGDVLEATKAS